MFLIDGNFDFFALAEAKFDQSVPTAQFTCTGYYNFLQPNLFVLGIT